ncbi:MAG: LysM peptidoglycan-binding domain-containing protein, partial [Duncaniella sp.]|nr:LysM peptidoglycan-binding domain-containing protein [Duncaniella sp.]
MTPLHRLGAVILAGLTALGAHAAIKDLPVKNINGKPFHYYKVPDHETVYSVLYKLGITKDELVSANPSVADGLKAGMFLYFPKEDGTAAETPAQAAGSVVRHVVERGETIIGIGRKYGLTVAEVMAQNPVLKDGLKAGQTIVITLPEGSAPVTEATAAVAEEPAQELIEMQGYLVHKGETLYSIAASHGITPADIEAANPNLGVLKAGQVLSLPLRKSPEAPAAPTPASAPAPPGRQTAPPPPRGPAAPPRPPPPPP